MDHTVGKRLIGSFAPFNTSSYSDAGESKTPAS